MKQLTTVLVGILLSLASSAQGLKIGDKVPDIYLHGLLDNDKDSISLRGEKDQVTILDFWNVRCKGCLKSMPAMDSLQAKFGKRLRLILVTYDNEIAVRAVFKKLKKQRPVAPMLIGDTVLNRLFHHEAEPMHAWISGEGIVKELASSYNTNTSNIEKALAGYFPKLPQRFGISNFDYGSSLLTEGAGRLSHLAASYSVLMPRLFQYLSGTGGKVESDSISGKPYLLKAINKSILELYSQAYNRDIYGFETRFRIPAEALPTARIILDTPHPEIFLPPADITLLDDWKIKNVVGYEIKVLPGEDLYASMQKDLDRIFQYTARIETRRMKCLVLRKTHEPDPNAPDVSVVLKMSEAETRNKNIFENIPFYPDFYRQILSHTYASLMPIIADPIPNLKINMVLEGDLGKIDTLKQQLYRYGYSLVEEEREIKILRISKKQE